MSEQTVKDQMRLLLKEHTDSDLYSWTHYSTHIMQGDTMSSGRIHVQKSFRKFWLVESWYLDTRSSGRRYIAQQKTNEQQPFTVWCFCCHWTMYPKFNFQPIRTWFVEWSLDMYHSIGHVLPCIVCYSRPRCPNVLDFYGNNDYLSQLMRLWYLSHRQPAKAQVSRRIRAVLAEPSLVAHIKYGSRQRVRPKIRHLAQLAHLKNEIKKDEKYHNLMRWLSFFLY